jgi:hypothetical protein
MSAFEKENIPSYTQYAALIGPSPRWLSGPRRYGPTDAQRDGVVPERVKLRCRRPRPWSSESISDVGWLPPPSSVIAMATELEAAGAGGDGHAARRDGHRGSWLGGSGRREKRARRSMIGWVPFAATQRRFI